MQEATVLLESLRQATEGHCLRVERLWSTGESSVADVALATDGRLVTATSGGVIAVWDAGGGPERSFSQSNVSADPVLSRSGAHVVFPVFLTADEPEGLEVWDTTKARKVATCDRSHAPHVESRLVIEHAVLVFEPEAAVVMVDSVGTLEEWDPIVGKLLRRIKLGRRPSRLAVTPDGKRAVVGFRDGGLQLVSLAAEGEVLRLLNTAQTRAIRDLDVSPAGRAAVSLHAGGVTTIWDLEEEKPLCTLNAGNASRAVFSLDGGLVVTAGGSTDATLVVWDSSLGREVDRLVLPLVGSVSRLVFANEWLLVGTSLGFVVALSVTREARRSIDEVSAQAPRGGVIRRRR